MGSLSCFKIFNEERDYLMKNFSDYIAIFYIIGNACFLDIKEKLYRFCRHIK